MHHQLKYSMIKLCSKKCVQWKTWDLKTVNVHYAASLLLLTLSDGLRSGINISLCDSISLNSLDFPGEKVGTSGSLRPESVHNILVHMYEKYIYNSREYLLVAQYCQQKLLQTDWGQMHNTCR